MIAVFTIINFIILVAACYYCYQGYRHFKLTVVETTSVAVNDSHEEAMNVCTYMQNSGWVCKDIFSENEKRTIMFFIRYNTPIK